MSNVIMQLEQLNVNEIPGSSSNTPSNISVEDVSDSHEKKAVTLQPSKWAKVKAANRRILPQTSRGETKLLNIIDELKKFTTVEQEIASHEEQITVTNPWNHIRLFRRRLTNFLQKPAFHYIVISLVITDLIVVLVDLVLAQLSAPCLTEAEMEEYNTTVQRDTCLLEYSVGLFRADLFLFYFSVLLLGLFVLEVFISFYGLGWKYYKNPLYLLDGIIVLTSFIMELYFHYGNIGRAGRAAAAIVILRLWKIIRAIHAIAHSISLRNRLLMNKIQEAQVSLEEEKQQAEQTLEKQELKVDYFTNILSSIGKLPSTNQIDTYVDSIWQQRNKPSE